MGFPSTRKHDGRETIPIVGMDRARHHHGEATIHDRHTSTNFTVRVPSTDIHACIRAPLWVALSTVVGVLLAITDIPRTGLTYVAQDHYKAVAPDTVMYWGPWGYHVAHLSVASSDTGRLEVNGSRDGKALQSLSVWAYKQDTLSIAPRAVASHLGVKSYPPCVLYRQECSSPELGLTTAFTMLDDLVESIQVHLFHDPILESQPFTFVTRNNWIDRLHHHLFRSFNRNLEVRAHHVYHISSRRHLNNATSSRLLRLDSRVLCGTELFSSGARPLFCDDPIEWMSDDPSQPMTGRRLPMWDHIAIRFDNLQRRYPHLDLDVTMFITTLKEQSQSTTHVAPSIIFATDALEITTLIRGRRCDSHANCSTEFVDDYRYERAALGSDEDQWKYWISGLRGVAQLYVWIRVTLLCIGCYVATSSERNFDGKPVYVKMAAACATILKIPGHTIVYGSWLPLIGYALAHYVDSSQVQTIGQFAWASVGGSYAFHPVEYVIVASIQMRNVWMIALLWKMCLLVVNSPLVFGRATRLRTLALRGGWIGTVSWLTTFSFMRALYFRDTDIVDLVLLPRHSSASNTHGYRGPNDFGYLFDLKCSLAAVVIVGSVGWLVQSVVHATTGQATSIFFCRSCYVPFSAGTLWCVSALDTVWLVRFRDVGNGRPRIFVGSEKALPSFQIKADETQSPRRAPSLPIASAGPTVSQCRVCSFQPSMLHWRSTQGCPKHEPIFDVHRRTKALWSMVRLMNIANMTDPIALFRLYVTGRTLYVYRVNSKQQPPYLLLLPMRMGSSDGTDPTRTLPRWAESRRDVDPTGAPSLELVRTVDSRDVPWHVLVNCG